MVRWGGGVIPRPYGACNFPPRPLAAAFTARLNLADLPSRTDTHSQRASDRWLMLGLRLALPVIQWGLNVGRADPLPMPCPTPASAADSLGYVENPSV